MVFKFTAAVVALATLPFVQTALINGFGLVILVVPALGFFLTFFGTLVIYSEPTLFSLMKEIYREYQSELPPKRFHDNMFQLTLGRAAIKEPIDDYKRNMGDLKRVEHDIKKWLDFRFLSCLIFAY